jgi:putative iron-only hydrogenase system regulator
METAEKRLALIGIIVEEPNSVNEINALFHQYRDYVIGRMGLPYKERKVSVISITIDAPQDIINTLSGKIGKLNGVSAKTIYSKI